MSDRNAKPRALYYSILKYQPESLDLLRRCFDVTVLESPAQDTLALLAQTEVLFAPLGFQVDKVRIDACPRLKVVASNTTGHPHIDVEYCRSRSVAVACLKFAQDFLDRITPTAELTFGMIIVLTRNMLAAHKGALAGTWDRRPFGAPAMLSRMRLGVVGLGRLGGRVAGYGSAFGMQVRYYDPFVASQIYERVTDLATLAQWCDVLSIHVPHEKETVGLIGRQVIEAMRPGSYLVNTARGELVEWQALLEALQSGHLAGAACDVFEGEFEPGFAQKYPEHPFLAYARTHDNVLLTPHIGGSTIDAWRETEIKTIEMARDVIAARAEG
jgi:D-3-phosphoglycerate dehydrogenase